MAHEIYLPRSVRNRIEQRLATGPHESAKPVKMEISEPRRPVFDVEGAKRPALVAEAALRGIVVTRGDGKDGEPTVEDFKKALSEAP